MDAPPIQYVTTSDGYNIAYAVSSKGRPYVFMPQPISHIQLYWRAQTFMLAWLEGLADRFRLVQYDGRGQGMSSRGLSPGSSPADLERDLDAVVKRLQLGRFILHATTAPGHTAIRYCVAHPERVEALILSQCRIGLPRAINALAAEDWDVFLRSNLPDGLTPAAVRASVENMKLCVSQGDWLELSRIWAESDIEALLPLIRTPTLVLHARDFLTYARPEESMDVAARIPGARFALIEGSTALGDSEQSLRAIEEFLSSLPAGGKDEKEPALPDVGLSSREVEVLRLVASGRSNQQIADALVISLFTVNRHVSNIFAKTGAANRAEATSYAHRNGLV
jgi:DNA-binding CsgD family transcriptional regulator/pimeloyl-ACP methyl ester carboxylesterase